RDHQEYPECHLRDAEVDDEGAEEEALFTVEPVAAARALLDHLKPSPEDAPLSAPGASLGETPRQQASGAHALSDIRFDEDAFPRAVEGGGNDMTLPDWMHRRQPLRL